MPGEWLRQVLRKNGISRMDFLEVLQDVGEHIIMFKKKISNE
jgi:hypothetical protein